MCATTGAVTSMHYYDKTVFCKTNSLNYLASMGKQTIYIFCLTVILLTFAVYFHIRRIKQNPLKFWKRTFLPVHPSMLWRLLWWNTHTQTALKASQWSYRDRLPSIILLGPSAVSDQVWWQTAQPTFLLIPVPLSMSVTHQAVLHKKTNFYCNIRCT